MPRKTKTSRPKPEPTSRPTPEPTSRPTPEPTSRPKPEPTSLQDDPPSIEPYTVLGIERNATADEVKSAYRKAALKSHPDKAAPEEKEQAHKNFQSVALAYAILSDERRRKRYDATGNTAESLDLDDDDFNWTDFFREQTAAMVDGAMIEKIRNEYQGSDEERQDVLRAYAEHEGNMDAVYEEIMCSNVLEDDTRFRHIIDQAIADGTVQSFKAYTKETKASQRKRKRQAEHEAEEAMALAEELGVRDKLFGSTGGKKTKAGKASKSSDGDHDALHALVQQRQKARATSFFDQLEAKYGGGSSGRRKKDEPPEEAFQKNAKKKGKARA
ncbi:hypothetical protein DV735_g4356, partial [Chaetothyriales sp. CBS 134920]